MQPFKKVNSIVCWDSFPPRCQKYAINTWWKISSKWVLAKSHRPWAAYID